MESKGMNWRKSSYSRGNGGSCVEVANTDHVLIGDTAMNENGPVPSFSASAWQEFASSIT